MKAAFTQADLTRAFKALRAAGIPVGAYEVHVDKDGLHLLPANSNGARDAAADLGKRIRGAFGGDGGG